MKALIDEKNQVAQVEQTEFGIAPPCFWVDCPENIVPYKYTYVGGNFVPVPEIVPSSVQNKEEAIRLLQESDFAVLADVNITNKTEWVSYRTLLRQIASNPSEGNLSWPVKPKTIWG
jgi:hypothetical protein